MVRYRQSLVEERARELNRIQAVLEGANIKLSSVVSDINGQTALSILRAMAKGETDARRLSSLAKGSLVTKSEELTRAFRGTIGEHQQKMIAHQLHHIDCLNQEIALLDEDVKKRKMRNHRPRCLTKFRASAGEVRSGFSPKQECTWSSSLPLRIFAPGQGLHPAATKVPGSESLPDCVKVMYS